MCAAVHVNWREICLKLTVWPVWWAYGFVHHVWVSMVLHWTLDQAERDTESKTCPKLARDVMSIIGGSV